MSYDLRVWSSDALPLETWLEAFPDAAASNGDFVLEGPNWIVRCAAPMEVQHEDLPDEVADRMPQIRWLTEITVEPIDAPASIRSRVSAGCRGVAKKIGGVFENPQTETFQFPLGPRRASIPELPRETTVSLISLSYWCTPEPLSTREGRAALIDFFSANLPEALPRRYGSFEPFEGKWAKGGKDAFLDYLDAHTSGGGSVFQDATRPVTDVTFGLRRQFDWYDGIFCCGDLKITLQLSALDDDVRRRKLGHVWRDLVGLCGAFATIVTIEDGWTMSRNGSLSYDRNDLEARLEDGSIVRNTVWRGIPRRPGFAFGLREDLARYWPALMAKGDHQNGFVFADTGDWRKRMTVASMLGSSPEAYTEGPNRTRAPRFFFPEPTSEQVRELELWNRRYDLLREEQAPILEELASVGITAENVNYVYRQRIVSQGVVYEVGRPVG